MSGILVKLQISWSIGKGLRSSVLGAETASEQLRELTASNRGHGLSPHHLYTEPGARLERSRRVLRGYSAAPVTPTTRFLLL